MEKRERLYPSAPFENKNNDLEQRLERKLNVVNSFNIYINNNIKEMITYFKDKNHKYKKKYKKFKTLTTKLKSFDAIAIIATTSSSFRLSPTGIGLLALPISTTTACVLSFGIKVTYEVIVYKYNKYKNSVKKMSKLINLLVSHIEILSKVR